MKKVVVGLSGGVDSSVAAWLLQQQGYEVIGLFMRNWHDTTGTLSGDCPWEDDQLFAELVAKRLDIPFHFVDLSEQYRARVVDYMFAEYERGRTPNPDVLCNREIKFDVFLQEALKLGADYVATGHYCRVERDANGMYRLLAGVDGNKDQSYFLCQLSQEQLSRAMFPIGRMLKPEVRRIAEEQKLATAKRKDSQGICFVGKVDLPTFLQQKLAARRGDIIEIPAENWEEFKTEFGFSLDAPLSRKMGGHNGEARFSGTKVGEHNGAHFYTIGQRKGLGVGGKAEPLFVIGTDVERNIVYVGQGDDHPGLWRTELRMRIEDVHWVRPDRALAAGESERFNVRVRYRQPLQSATLIIEAAVSAISAAEGGAVAGGGEQCGKICGEPGGGKTVPEREGGAVTGGGEIGTTSGGAVAGIGAVNPVCEGGTVTASEQTAAKEPVARIVFDSPQRGITPGQFAAWYDGDELIGSGVILQ